MTANGARKGTPKPVIPTLTKKQHAAIARVVARVLAESTAIEEIVEAVAQDAMAYATEYDEPNYKVFADAAVLAAADVVPKLVRKAGKELVTREFVQSVIAGFW